MSNEYLKEIVVKAWGCSRPFTTKDPDSILRGKIVKWLANKDVKHYGVKVYTNKGHYWLIHNAYSNDRKEFGIYVTDAKHMSENWSCKEFTVKRENVTISQCQVAMNWRGDHTKEDWLRSGTCLGAAAILVRYLSDPKFNGKINLEPSTMEKLLLKYVF